MLPELLRFSSASHLLEHIPEEMQAHHRSSAPALARPAAAERGDEDIWAGWGERGEGNSLLAALEDSSAGQGLDLALMGL